MSEAAWIVAGIALLLAGLALLMWRWARRRQIWLATKRHLALHIAAGANTVAGPGVGAARTASPFDRRPAQMPMPMQARTQMHAQSATLDPWAMAPSDLAGLEATATSPGAGRLAQRLPGWLQGVATPTQLGTAAAVGLVAVLCLAVIAGPVAAAGLLALLCAAGSLGLWMLRQKFRRRLVSQLPGFIDGMVRLIKIGNSPQAAFQLSLPALKTPLREPMERAGALMRAGVDLDQALAQMANQMRIEEMHLLAAILGLGVRYGGRADTLLDRVAAYMRDREQAEQELVAMSSETRLSAWILGLMPIGVGASIMLINPSYFARMWHDGTGQMMIFGALGLQVFGALLLYRLARLD